MQLQEYKADIFTISIRKAYEELDEFDIKPTSISGYGQKKPEQYEKVQKKRHYLALESFDCKGIIVSVDLLEVIDFITCLNSFINNKFDTNIKYETAIFNVQVVQQNKNVSLQFDFFRVDIVVYLDKVKASLIANRLNKIISKLEL